MNGRTWIDILAITVASTLVQSSRLGALEVDIGPRAIERAIALGREAQGEAHDRLNRGYRVKLGGPTLVELEIFTEFRRTALAAADRARLGDRMWGVAQAMAMLRPFRGQLSVVAHVTFPPTNVYRVVPAYDIVLLYDTRSGARAQPAGAAAIYPIDVRRVGRYVAGQLAPPGSPMLGASIEAVVDARRLDPRGTYLATLRLDGRELERVPLDFAAVE